MRKFYRRRVFDEGSLLLRLTTKPNVALDEKAPVFSETEMQIIVEKIDHLIEQFGLGEETGIVAINISQVFIDGGYRLDQAELVLEELKRVHGQLNVMYFICYLHIIAKCPADMMALMKFTSKILSLDKKSPDRGPKTVLKSLELMEITNLSYTENLINLMEKAGTEAAKAVMDFQKSFEGSDQLMDLYIVVAETGRIEELSRLDNLVNYLRQCKIDPAEELAIIKQLVETGEQAMAIATLAAMEDVYSQPAKLPKLEIN